MVAIQAGWRTHLDPGEPFLSRPDVLSRPFLVPALFSRSEFLAENVLKVAICIRRPYFLFAIK